LFPARDGGGALAREGIALPSAPALAQAHPGDARHQVELGRPHVAELPREDLELVADRPPVVRVGDLRGHVGVLVETNIPWAVSEHSGRLAGWKATEIGHADFDDEPAAGCEVSSDVAKALDLLILGGQVRDRVEHEVGEPE